MIPPGRSIPLGSVQVMKPDAQPATPTAWSEVGVRVDVIRFRFTPARGEFYGPPAAAQATPPAVKAGTNDFLRANAGWFRSPRDARPGPLQVLAPDDTIDMIDERQQLSLGVVDDTCDARIEVTLSLPDRPRLSAHATVFVGPPDFAPDRRPFLSVADELNDRVGDAGSRNAAVSPTDHETWVEDLFERVFETAALFNVDWYRTQWWARLPPNRLTPAPGIPGDELPRPTYAMGARDQLRSLELGGVGSADGGRLPLSERARERHRDLSDIDSLTDFVSQHHGRLGELIRGPFELESVENASFEQTMRMPPFMRNSNYNPLTLSAWQYALLMAWVRDVEEAPAISEAAKAVPPARRIRAFAAQRREAVLARLGRRRPS